MFGLEIAVTPNVPNILPLRGVKHLSKAQNNWAHFARNLAQGLSKFTHSFVSPLLAMLSLDLFIWKIIFAIFHSAIFCSVVSTHFWKVLKESFVIGKSSFYILLGLHIQTSISKASIGWNKKPISIFFFFFGALQKDLCLD